MDSAKPTALQATGSSSTGEEAQLKKTSLLTEEMEVRRAEAESTTMRAELKHMSQGWANTGRAYYIEEFDAEEDLGGREMPSKAKYALCVVRQYDQQNQWVTKITLQVHSQALKAILRRVIGTYPGESFHSSDVNIDFPAHCLYHYRDELNRALAQQKPGSDGAAHLPLLLKFIDEHFASEINEGGHLLRQGLVTFNHLWTIFKPGQHVCTNYEARMRAYKLQSYFYTGGKTPSLQLVVEYVDFDGGKFGTRSCQLLLPVFRDTKPIAKLPVLPLAMHQDFKGVARMLIARGRLWQSLAGQNFRHYKGVAMGPWNRRWDRHWDRRYHIDDRIMIDAATHHRINPDTAFEVTAFPSTGGGKRKRSADSDDDYDDEVTTGTPAPLSEQQCLLASPLVRGYSFTERLFLDFAVDGVSDIKWNVKCFEQLVLPDHEKELVQALVSEHALRVANQEADFADIVKGNGQGLKLVLYGPPGVGKTLTAECVAEFYRRPLFAVSAGVLGTNASDLHKRLSFVMDLASTWKAVLLIDEADAFLGPRYVHDMERNALATVFLRSLEHYPGILIMTTNRVAISDDAFKSGIHVALRYRELTAAGRAMVWKNSLADIEGGTEIDENGYEKLAEATLNGRQIRDVVRTAKCLAEYRRTKLDTAQLEEVMRVQMAAEGRLENLPRSS